MKCKPFVLGLSIAVLAMIVIAGSASATAWIQWAGGPQIQLTKIEIPIEERGWGEHWVWQLGNNWASGYTFDLTGDVPNHLHGTIGGDPGDFLDEDFVPIFVRLSEAVTNVGTEWWGDYHIRTRDGGVPYKACGNFWPNDWNISDSPDLEGWDFVRENEASSYVLPGQTLRDEVWIYVDSMVDGATIEKWPTVPEPASLAVLGAGLFGLGGVIFRRFKR